MASNNFRHTATAEALAALSAKTLTNDELQSLLANAFERIAALEHDHEELGMAFKWLRGHIEGSAQ